MTINSFVRKFSNRLREQIARKERVNMWSRDAILQEEQIHDKQMILLNKIKPNGMRFYGNWFLMSVLIMPNKDVMFLLWSDQGKYLLLYWLWLCYCYEFVDENVGYCKTEN